MGKVVDCIGILRTPARRCTGGVSRRRGHAVESVIDIFPLHRDRVEELRGASHVFVFYPLPGDGEKQCPVEVGGKSLSAGNSSLIGRSVLRLNGILGSLLVVAGIDMKDRTPILDIRPFRVDSRLCSADSLY